MNLGRFADGGAGLVFQEGTAFQRSGRGTLSISASGTTASCPGYVGWLRFVEACGVVPGIQVVHAGQKSRGRTPFEGRGPLPFFGDAAEWKSWQPVSASGVPYYKDGGRRAK
jgi:2,4-dienoyl-CoA reductase-like NADH-dependent reductase (Old Yellow Enzyme family)